MMAIQKDHASQKALLPLIGVSLLLLLGLVVMYFAQSQSTEMRSKAAQFKGSCAAEERPRCKQGQKAVCSTTKENIKAMNKLSKEEKKTFMEGIADSFKWECQKVTVSGGGSASGGGSGGSDGRSGGGEPKPGEGGGCEMDEATTQCYCENTNRVCRDNYGCGSLYPSSPECE